MDSVSGVGVLDKSVAVLEVLAERGPSSLAELVDATAFSRPTTHRLAVALETHGLVSRDERGRFRLGARLAAWGRSAARIDPVIAHAASVVADLRDATGESAQVYVREGGHRVCVAVAERPSGLRDTVPLGARLSLAAGSGAKVLLAWADPGSWPAGTERARVGRGAKAGLGGFGGGARSRRRERERARALGRRSGGGGHRGERAGGPARPPSGASVCGCRGGCGATPLHAPRLSHPFAQVTPGAGWRQQCFTAAKQCRNLSSVPSVRWQSSWFVGPRNPPA